MDIKSIETELSKIFEVDEMGENIVVRSQFFTSCDDSTVLAICISKSDEGIVLTDMCETYQSLMERGIEIDNAQNREKLDRILEYSLVEFDDESKEFFLTVENLEDVSFAVVRLFQAILVAGAFDIYN